MIMSGLFVTFLQVATCDLLVEAKQSEEVKDNAECGPEFFTFTWMGIVLGIMIVIVCTNYFYAH